MLRKLALLVLIGAVIGLGVFWFVTIPATVPASALPQRAPNLENGKTMFFIGGCASCHATPGQDEVCQIRLGSLVALLRRVLQPMDGLLGIECYPGPGGIKLSQHTRSGRVSLLSRTPQPDRGLGVIRWQFATSGIEMAD